MCPLCLANLAIVVAGVVSGSGVAAVALQHLASSGTRPAQPANKEK
jgi:hypothetical protein